MSCYVLKILNHNISYHFPVIPRGGLGSIMGHDGTIGEMFSEWRLNQHLNFTNNMMINIVVNLIIKYYKPSVWASMDGIKHPQMVALTALGRIFCVFQWQFASRGPDESWRRCWVKHISTINHSLIYNFVIRYDSCCYPCFVNVFPLISDDLGGFNRTVLPPGRWWCVADAGVLGWLMVAVNFLDIPSGNLT